MNRFFCALLVLFLLCPFGASAGAADKLNLLLITVDDMSADSIGAFGCKLPDTTPNIDRLAKEGLRFTRAHVQVGNCMPSRNVMWSGRYPHNNGVEGFYQVKDPGYPVLDSCSTTRSRRRNWGTTTRRCGVRMTAWGIF